MNKRKTENILPGAYIKGSRGITLIELMIVVAIIAILGGIGYPMYAEQIKKARRGDAQGALYGLANAMEQYATRNPNTGYADAAAGNSGPPIADVFPQTWAPLDGPESNKYYDLTLVVVVDAGGYGGSYTLSAAPTGKMAGDTCGTFTLDNIGNRDDGTGGGCWK